ncbi:hypothetical protein ACJX0J_013406, partial [Zea mays]
IGSSQFFLNLTKHEICFEICKCQVMCNIVKKGFDVIVHFPLVYEYDVRSLLKLLKITFSFMGATLLLDLKWSQFIRSILLIIINQFP